MKELESKAKEMRKEYENKFNETLPLMELPDMSYEEEIALITKCISENKTAFEYYPTGEEIY